MAGSSQKGQFVPHLSDCPCFLVLAFLSLEHPNAAQKSGILYCREQPEPRSDEVAETHL